MIELDLRGKKEGDVIECDEDDLKECFRVMHKLSAEGVETEPIYEYHGKSGLWLKITKMETT